MSKRADGKFVRVERGFYPTPMPPVLRLSPFLAGVKTFAEPFVGNGALMFHLQSLGYTCEWKSDLKPTGNMVDRAVEMDGLDVTEAHLSNCDVVLSNPPWPEKFKNGEPTLGLIRHFASLRPTWLLLAADFMHNVYAPEVLAYCSTIVSVGRVKWIEDSDGAGFDNAAWYLFDKRVKGPPVFHGVGPAKPVFAAELEELL